MADWDLSFNVPSVGQKHTTYVVKPANCAWTATSGTGIQADPWIIAYQSGTAAPADPREPQDLSTRKAGAPFREAWLEVHLDGTRVGGDRPPVRDGVGGGSEFAGESDRSANPPSKERGDAPSEQHGRRSAQ